MTTARHGNTSSPWRHNEHDGVSRLYAQPFIQAQIKENIKAPRYWRCVLRGIHRSPVNSPHKAPVTRKKFPFHDVIMTFPINGEMRWIHQNSCTKDQRCRVLISLSLAPRNCFGEILIKIQNFSLKNAAENIAREMVAILSRERWVNSLRHSDAIWRQKTGSALAQVMTCCLTAPNHYLKQCWLFISKDLWRSWDDSFSRDTSAINHQI